MHEVTEMTDKIIEKLNLAYRQLGVTESEALQTHVEDALAYYARGRERYIELTEPGTQFHLVDIEQGATGHLIPIAQAHIAQPGDGCTCQITKTASLWVSGEEAQYVFQLLRTDIPLDPAEKESHYFATYEKANPEDFTADFQLLPPAQMIPIATEAEQKIYAMLYDAFDRNGSYRDERFIHHKAEQALQMLLSAEETELHIGEDRVFGKLVELAADDLRSEHRSDCSYSHNQTLCLVQSGDHARFLMKSHHVYRYLRKVPVDETLDDGYYFQETGEKQEITYRFASLDEVDRDFTPFFY